MKNARDDHETILEEVFRHTPVGVALLDLHGTIFDANPALSRILGLESSSLIGTGLTVLVVTEDVPVFGESLQTLRDGTTETSIESLRLCTPDGSRINVSIKVSAVGSDDGEPAWCIAFIESLEDRLRIEYKANERIRESENRLQQFFQNVPLALWESDWTEIVNALRDSGFTRAGQFPSRASETVEIFDSVAPHIRITAVNRVALELAGVDTLEEFQQWIPSFQTPDSMRRFLVAGESLLFNNVRSITVPITFVSRSGKETEGLIRTTRMTMDEDDWRMIVVAQDVSEHARIGRELRERQDLMSRVEAAAHIGSWEWNPATGLVRGSPEFWRIIDDKAGGAAERKIDETFRVIHPEDRPVMDRLLEMALEPDTPRPASLRQELRLLRPDGSVTVASAQIFFWYGERGVIDRAFGTLRDVTEIVRAEAEAARHREEMIRADKMISLGILVSGVAHEINNPNHSIKLNVPFLREAWKETSEIIDRIVDNGDESIRITGSDWSEVRDEIPEVLTDIEHASDRIGTIVGELKGFSVDRERGAREPTCMNEVVESALRLLSNIIRSSTQNLRVELAEDLPRVHAVAQSLEQVIVNLIVNACQALESDQKGITVRTSSDGEQVFVSVIDEGTGITRENITKITDPFFTTKRPSGGTGLGLSVSQRIVDDHRGRLQFESEPGRGTTATLSIPIPEEPEATNE